MPFVSTSSRSFSTVSHSAPFGGTGYLGSISLFNQNAGRSEMFIQVVGSGSNLFVAFNAQPASHSNFNAILKAASDTYEADGGTLWERGYIGPVTVSGGIECRFIAWEDKTA